MNRVILITGASRGLGLALAEKFISAGDTVYGVSRTRKHWKDIPDSLIDSGRFHLTALDLTSEAGIQSWLKSIVKKSKRIDLIINNAGVGTRLERIEKIHRAELEKSFQHNLFSAFFVCKHALPILKKQGGGTIFNVASMAGVRAVPRLFSYSAAKFGMLALSQAVAKENADWKLKCVTICPGGMNTTMRSDLFGKEDAAKQQSAEFVADIMLQIADDKIKVESGGHIIIRHKEITGIFPPPGA